MDIRFIKLLCACYHVRLLLWLSIQSWIKNEFIYQEIYYTDANRKYFFSLLNFIHEGH